MNLVLSENRMLRIGSMMIFYFAQGLPIGLFQTGVTSWLAADGQSAGAVAAIIATIYTPWSFKFIIAPMMDRYAYLPMGRRRVWIVASQLVMLLGLAVAALAAPTQDELLLLSYVGFAIFCGSAAQDVAVDGLAVDILPEKEQGMASAFMFGGQALGIAAGGIAGGFMLQNFGSATTFLAFAPLNILFILLALILRERPGEKLLPWTAGKASAQAMAKQTNDWLLIVKTTLQSLAKRDSVVMLIAQAFGRTAGGATTAFWPIFGTGPAGWSTSEYSSLIGTTGLIASVACMGIGTILVGRFGPRLSSIITYAGYAIMALVYLFAPEIAAIGYVFVILSLYWNMTDTLTSLSSNPLRMRLCDKRVAATQFTIYNSIANLFVPLGAYIVAITAGYGNQVLLPIIILLTVCCCLGYAMMRIGGPGEELRELEPRVD